MIRPAAIALACLFAAPLGAQTSSPAAQETTEQRAERCGIQAGIVEAAVEQRSKKRRQKRAVKTILKSEPIKDTKYEANVDVLVAWIYSIPERQLNQDTVTAFAEACLKFEG
ncbi:MAG: hypothetical protein ACRBBS_11015 [Thalassovita sp.]